MAYVKHPVHGNKNVNDSEVEALVKAGWVKWPRTDEEKELGDGSDAAYWRKKYERDVQPVDPRLGPSIESEDGVVEVNAVPASADEVEPVKARRGRPAKA